MCDFQVSRPYLDFCPDLKHFIVQNEQSLVKYGGKCGKYGSEAKYSYKI